jgi:isocitrate lyase
MAGLEHNSTLWLSIYKGLTRHQTQYINKSINMSEKADFEAEVKALEEFQKVSPPLVSSGLADPRFSRTVRPYTAADVVSKRGTLPLTYPSDVMAQKLHKLLEAKKNGEGGGCTATYGA